MKKTPETREKEYHGFSLQSVCWGYRDIFTKAIDGLFADELIGSHQKEVTAKLFEFLKCADKACFDHVLKEFLCALNPDTRWIMALPGIFADVVNLGRHFSEMKLCYGIQYFEILGKNGFGDTPDDVRRLIRCMKRIGKVDYALAMAFAKGYARLNERLHPHEIDRYINEGLRVFYNKRSAGIAFMNGGSQSSENVIKMLTRECRLEDMEAKLTTLLRALTGYDVEVADISKLDSDDLIEHGTNVVCMYQWLYLPRRIRVFADAKANRRWYMLITLVSAGMLAEKSFCRIQGYRGYETCKDIVGSSILMCNLFQIAEICRVINRIRAMWPGARQLIDHGFKTEFDNRPPRAAADKLLHMLVVQQKIDSEPLRRLHNIAMHSSSAFETASRIETGLARRILAEWPGLDMQSIRAFGFIPDFLFPSRTARPPDNALIADMRDREKKRNDAESSARRKAQQKPFETDDSGDNRRAGTSQDEREREEAAAARPACYIYDEWSQDENDYLRDYCFVHEIRSAAESRPAAAAAYNDEVRHVRRLFELLKPRIIKHEKYLDDGDAINLDLLTLYLVSRHREPSPKINFYEKPLMKKRDIAVLILFDVSGSTAEHVDKRTVLDIEKQAALIFGHGLAVLGDRFSVAGFTSNGRENCDYYICKDFDEPWNNATIGRVQAAYPRSSTRMGPALRHSGYRLSQIDARQRLILLITDGKPQDTRYDPATRYAQYDIRMACEENLHRCIYTFCISTEENSRADMEIMFPNRRFAILSNLKHLPRLLPQLYIKMTV